MGSFSDSATNYGVGVKFGDHLMLPAAGIRSNEDGALNTRGYVGYYWSSTEFVNFGAGAWYLYCSSDAYTNFTYFRTYGLSVRCVAE